MGSAVRRSSFRWLLALVVAGGLVATAGVRWARCSDTAARPKLQSAQRIDDLSGIIGDLQLQPEWGPGNLQRLVGDGLHYNRNPVVDGELRHPNQWDHYGALDG